eukprot:m.45969 g.45969  ORF g.45969 m.45969 type:complete len:402 (-) comp12213_c0_seq1:294-1499(-)
MSTPSWRRVLKDLHAVIGTVGPMTVAGYMKHVLTHPLTGYYVSQKPFDGRGDFITGPEISQMFGEMVGAWTAAEWNAVGQPKPVHLIELGPGTGLLMKDIINTLHKLAKQPNPVTDVHLVEASPLLSQKQYETLGCGKAPDLSLQDLARDETYLTGRGIYDIQFHWHRHQWTVSPPNAFTFLYAHEFFDAMPVHQFQLTEHGWRERLVDICEDSEHELRFVLSPSDTVHSKMYSRLPFVRHAKQGDVGEASFEAMEQVESMAKLINNSTLGGRALIFDYGDVTKFSDTFRGFRDHQQVHVFDQPGTADLTADVNFDHLTFAAARSHGVHSFGPMTQQHFLLACGLQQRANAILQAAADQNVREAITRHVEMLTSPASMGHRFKVMVMTDSRTAQPPVLFGR